MISKSNSIVLIEILNNTIDIISTDMNTIAKQSNSFLLVRSSPSIVLPNHFADVFMKIFVLRIGISIETAAKNLDEEIENG